MPVSRAEANRILERDRYRCCYCGLDGRASFENALVMAVDFIVPRARKGQKDPANWWPAAALATPSRALGSKEF
jgi:5-methylcytosine-specific restriction endonuclease McrA